MKLEQQISWEASRNFRSHLRVHGGTIGQGLFSKLRYSGALRSFTRDASVLRVMLTEALWDSQDET